jgi:MFS transporter, DHA2 family, multidrug resistance protein
MQQQTAATEHALSGWQLVVATFGISIGTLLITLDQFIANVSIPNISGDLGVSQDNGSWVITSYVVANAVTVPMTGWLTGVVGRVRLFYLSIFLFVTMSVLCGIAPSFKMLLIFRVLQGLSSGALIPLSQALLLTVYPTKKGFAMGIWGLVVMVGPALGPVVGGWVTDNINWRWIFYINVPIGLPAGFICLFLLRHLESKRIKSPIDLVGLTLLVLSVGAYQIMLDRGYDDDWFSSRFIVSLAIISFISFCFLLVWELTHPHPILHLHAFKSRNFTMGNIVLAFAVLAIFGNLIVAPIWTFSQLDYTPLWSGYAIAPFGVAALFIFPLVGQYADRIDLRIWVFSGFALFAISFFFIAYLYADTPFGLLAWPRFLQGIGFAFFYVPLTTVALSEISDAEMPYATSLFSFIRLIFISSGVSFATNFYYRREVFFQSRFVDYVIPSNPQFAPYYAAVKEHTGLTGNSVDAFVQQMIERQAYTQTFLELCYISAWIYAILAFVSLCFNVKKKRALAK